MNTAMNATITKLVLAACDAAGITTHSWQTRLRINAARLSRLRAGRASLTDAELDRITRVTGEPWQNLVLSCLGNDSELTADTRDLLGNLHSLARTADSESADHRKRRKQFGTSRQWISKKSA